MEKIHENSTVTVNYTGKLEDGTIFDTSLVEGREPLNAKLGEGQLIPGFEAGLIDMVIGETKTVEIEPSSAYGEYNDTLVVEIAKSNVAVCGRIGVAHSAPRISTTFIIT